MIVQFGTSRFLQAHVDLFASEARDAGQDVPGIMIVQTTDDPVRARRLAAFADPAGFPVIVRGLEDGAAVERIVQVRSVVGGLQAHADAAALRALLAGPATHIVSNTGDVGFRNGSFVAILLAGLYARWQAGAAGLTLLPCELVSRNGDALRDAVIAAAAGRAPAFVAWLGEECRWGNTLVDRIVSAPLEPAGAVAEPYALWAIERQPGLALPFSHPAVVLTDDLEPFERLKLHILNLGHSWLAERWQAAGARAGTTVREALADRATRAALDELLAQEVVPGFAMRGLEDEARRYAATTIERFANPYLDHLLRDIHAHHAQKVGKRIGAFVRWVDERAEQAPAMPQLRALAVRYDA